MSSALPPRNGTAETADHQAASENSPHQSDRVPGDEPADAWKEIVARGSELREYAEFYLAANIDRLRLTGRLAVMWTVIGIIVGIIISSTIAAASVLFVVALSGGISELLGRGWLGQLVVSTTILIAASGGLWLVLRRGISRYQRALVEKYEHRKQQQRKTYGTDVEQRAQRQSQDAEPRVK